MTSISPKQSRYSPRARAFKHIIVRWVLLAIFCMALQLVFACYIESFFPDDRSHTFSSYMRMCKGYIMKDVNSLEKFDADLSSSLVECTDAQCELKNVWVMGGEIRLFIPHDVEYHAAAIKNLKKFLKTFELKLNVYQNLDDLLKIPENLKDSSNPEIHYSGGLHALLPPPFDSDSANIDTIRSLLTLYFKIHDKKFFREELKLFSIEPKNEVSDSNGVADKSNHGFLRAIFGKDRVVHTARTLPKSNRQIHLQNLWICFSVHSNPGVTLEEKILEFRSNLVWNRGLHTLREMALESSDQQSTFSEHKSEISVTLINSPPFKSETNSMLDTETFSSLIRQNSPNIHWNIIQFDSSSDYEEVIARLMTTDVVVGMSEYIEWWMPAFLICPHRTLMIELAPKSEFFWNLAHTVKRKYVRSSSEYLSFITASSSLKFPSSSVHVDRTLLDPLALANLLLNSVEFQKSKYLLYMPWEQLNNQLIEFKTACAIASQLNRILVLPYLGYRNTLYSQQSSKGKVPFNVKNFQWSPIEFYFNENFISANAPCKVITAANFKSLFFAHDEINIGNLYFNPFTHSTKPEQLRMYYEGVLKLPVGETIATERLYQLSKESVIDTFGGKNTRFLSLGCTFWMYGFEKSPAYPPPGFVDFMDNELYKKITYSILGAIRGRRIPSPSQGSVPKKLSFIELGSVKIRKDLGLGAYVDELLNSPEFDAGGYFVSLHLRRGDYWYKCRRIADNIKRNQCFPSKDRVVEVIEEMTGRISQLADAEKSNIAVYVATNSIQEVRKELGVINSKFKLIFFDDITSESSGILESLDYIEKSLLDMLICSFSDEFYGNYFSSFTRSIIEMRNLAGSKFQVF